MLGSGYGGGAFGCGKVAVFDSPGGGERQGNYGHFPGRHEDTGITEYKCSRHSATVGCFFVMQMILFATSILCSTLYLSRRSSTVFDER